MSGHAYTREVSLRFGPMAPALNVQLAGQGLRLDEYDAANLHELSHAINRLMLRDILSDSEVRKARTRLLNLILAAARPLTEEAL